jgi:hypothetical protein
MAGRDFGTIVDRKARCLVHAYAPSTAHRVQVSGAGGHALGSRSTHDHSPQSIVCARPQHPIIFPNLLQHALR